MTIPAEQAPVDQFLRELLGAAPLETHISAVYVGRDRVLKLKKAVDLGFLDFKTLAARELYCRREYELNAPAAPGIYRGVWPVTESDPGRFALGGPGQVLDWVVEMAPLPAEGFLDAMAQGGRVDMAVADALGDAVHALHTGLQPLADVDPVKALAGVIAGNLKAAEAAGLPGEELGKWRDAIQAAHRQLSGLMRERAAQGFVRRCHGDLHLGNLVMWEGRPTAFDALEFSEDFARIDLGYDLSFLLMDCDCRVSRAVANRVMNRYIARSGDVGLLAAMPFYLSMRALIRAHCEARVGREGRSYLKAALDYLSPLAPRIVAVGGLQGTGKTWLARQIAPLIGCAPGAVHLRSDEIRKRLCGVAPEEKLPPKGYEPAMSAEVYDELRRMAATALRAGHSVVVDAVFLQPDRRAEIEVLARENKARFDGIWLSAPLEVLEQRVANRHGDASDADVSVLRQASKADPGPLSPWKVIDATDGVAGRAMTALALIPPSAC
ncbi:AAA family ATPase [Acetobacteraceae bacterium H6797]|nr:AAA family ATPase [Acetobacteraceae bacterium H6797]